MLTALPMWISYSRWISWISIFSQRRYWVDFVDYCGFRFLLLLLLLKMYLFQWHCHAERCRGTLHSQLNWQLVVQKTRVKKECFQFSSEGGERRCSPYGWRQTVPCPWSGDRERSVAQGWSPDKRYDQSCCGWRAQVTTALDVSYPADTVSEVRRSCAVETAERQNTEAEPYPLWDAQPVEIAQKRRDALRTPL